MATLLFPSPVYGPVRSRRMGVSLGVNLMPADGKVCSFDCLYCECGFNREHVPHTPRPTREDVRNKLSEKLAEMHVRGEQPDVITFAGNGEPTLHPQFGDIIGDTLALRDRYCPEAKVSVLSNATCLHRPSVRAALARVDNNILKLDTVNPDYIRRVDRPAAAYDPETVVERMKQFGGHVIVQTLFMQGDEAHPELTNTGEEYVAPWLEALRRIGPQSVMIYTIDRETPDPSLRKATPRQLDSIRKRVEKIGIPATVSY